MVVASSRFAKGHLVTAAVETRLAGAIQDCGEHAFADLRENRADVQFALHARREIFNFILAVGVLQIVKSPAIGERRRERRELQRGDLNPFAKTGHPRDSAIGRRHGRKRTRMFIRQIVPRKFSQAEKTAVLGNRLESHARPELLKKNIIRVRHRFRQVHVLAAPNLEHSVTGDDIFFQGGKCDGRLDRGARNVAFAKGNFLIHNREDASGVRIYSDHRPIVTAESGDRSCANNGIIVGAIVGAGRIRKRRDSAIPGSISPSALCRRSRTRRRRQR